MISPSIGSIGASRSRFRVARVAAGPCLQSARRLHAYHRCGGTFPIGYDDAHALKTTSRWVACLPEVAVRTTQEAYRMSFESRKMAIHDRDVEEYAESEEFSLGFSIDSDGHWHERIDRSPWSDIW